MEPAMEPAPVGKMFDTRIYGFIASSFEKVAATPAGVDASGNTVMQTNTSEFDVLHFNLMIQGLVASKYRYFINFDADGAGAAEEDAAIGVRNAWVEAPLFGDWLSLRTGKLYRRFGLYNEVLDAVPQFNGIEAPEYLDKDHLLLTRTTNVMLHGRAGFGENAILYAIATGQDERSRDDVPIGFDARFQRGTLLTVGASMYSTNGKGSPLVSEGSPRGGVINWMATDRYMATGLFAQLNLGSLTLEAEGFTAHHEGTRNPEAVVALQGAGLNERQFERFFNGCSVGTCDETNVETDAKYDVRTGYLNAAYELYLGRLGAATPYTRVDFYSNPETIANKDFGGDDEAGLTDDGEFIKSTIGVIYRPVPAIAVKVDGSTHTQTFNDESLTYPEIRVHLSYLWEL